MNQTLTFGEYTFNFDDLVSKANSGDTTALGMLGDAFNTGVNGVPKDKKVAMQYYERAANAGEPGALFKVGLEYFDGGYYSTNEKLGEKYLKQSADKGYMHAQYMYGCHLRGKKKARKSAHYFELAAMQGQDKAQYELGVYCFFEAQNIDNAIYWLCHSSLRGNADANAMLNEMIQRGVPRAHERIQNTYAQIQNG